MLVCRSFLVIPTPMFLNNGFWSTVWIFALFIQGHFSSDSPLGLILVMFLWIYLFRCRYSFTWTYRHICKHCEWRIVLSMALLGVNTKVDQIPFYLKILFYTNETCVKYGVCGSSVSIRISCREAKLKNNPSYYSVEQ